MAEYVMEAKGIGKSFPGVRALDNIDINIKKGEVVALLGENGAGKSTLIKILSGVYQPDEGEIFLNGKKVMFEVPLAAKNAGIGVIHQELNYVASVSVAENIFIGSIPKKYGFVDYRKMYAESRQILSVVGLDIDPKTTMGACSVAQKQLIELAKVISNHAQVIIMDEPTSSLNDTEVKNLLNFVHKAASEGVAIFYISHKLDELFEIADRVVVLRDGKKTGELNIRDATKDELIARMVGRDLTDMYPKEILPIGDEILRVEGLETDYIRDISFSTRKGEIFGIYGLMGSGHQNVGTAIFGQDILHKGRISVHGKPVRINDPMDAINAGMAYCPAERKTEGLVLNQSVAVNIMSSAYCKAGSVFVNYKKDEAVANKWIESLRIKTPSYKTDTVSLSGGNQQRSFCPSGWN